ncbi:MAG: L-2-amino-thiazoline-4-carboxylic acid hydrolase [Clostridia bacterium]|nr:L-2-amino-thiazoline-4-carboxylic acid hydrolase [Clostridia bacterium]
MKTVTPEACKKIIRRKPITKSLYNGFAANGWKTHLPAVYERAAELFADNAGAGKALMTHLNQLLPMIALYEKAAEITGSREDALAFMDKWAFIETEKMMKYARGLMKLGLYRLMPSMCEMLLDRMFGKTAGFEYRRVPDAPKFAADMLRCPYFETFKKYGCPELTQFCCRADDITYGNLHKNLVWARSQTLGMGGGCCDFRLYVKQDGGTEKS